jgi:serine/threonine protein kinase/tetratricopeptide (TPR) repeat protein
MSPPKPDEAVIFHGARQIPPGARRQFYLQQACGTDASLLARLEALLRVYDEDRNFLAEPAEGVPDVPRDSISEGPGTRIGPYRLQELIGEGGFGKVFMAGQEQPVQRQVALKIVKPGMDTRDVIARFESERQALALLSHPNIAQIFDGGETASGRPYFVMELVKGLPITEFCDQNHLAAEDRLKLFGSLCHAIQHAHFKGVIHRDIKPTNVMVTLHDGVPVVKVIDFGIAKAMAQKLSDETRFTGYGELVGTPAYMSPEQAEMSGLDVDTRADIYSLGVLLYELLTGTTPLDTAKLREAGFAEMQRLIREEVPRKPSTRLSSLGDAATILASNRATEPKHLVNLLAGDLDWIVMKALEKDRARRYASPGDFADDVQRYLHREPILARPPSLAYRVRKFTERHRTAVLVAAAFVLLLIGTTTVSTTSAFRATRAELAAGQDRDRAVAEKNRANEEASIARAVTSFVRNELLAQADIANQRNPGRRDRNITVRELLDRAAERIEGRFPGQELTEAAIRLTIGNAYMELGQFAKAQPQLARARQLREQKLGSEHVETLECMDSLSKVHWLQGRLDDAEALCQKVVEVRRQQQGDDHLDTLNSLNNLATLMFERGSYDTAERLYEQILDAKRASLGADHAETLQSMNNLAVFYGDRGRYEEAERILRQVLERRQKRQGPDHPATLGSMNNLATLLWERGRYDEAEPLFRTALEANHDKQGPTHPSTLLCMENLGVLLGNRGRFQEAEKLQKQALEARRATLDPDHRDVLSSLSNLAVLYRNHARPAQAEPLFLQVLEIQRVKLPVNHLDTLRTLNNLGALYSDLRRYDDAIRLQQQALKGWRVQVGGDDARTIQCMGNLATLYLDRGRYDDSEPLFSEAIAGARKVFGLGDRRTQQWIFFLAAQYRKQGRPERAEPLLREMATYYRDKSGADSEPYAAHLAILALNLLDQKRFAEAEAEARRAEAILGKQDPNGWRLFETKTFIGAALSGQEKYAEAEPILVQGFEGMKAREARIPNAKGKLNEACGRVVQLYTAWNRPDLAAEWRKKLETSQPPKSDK